MVSLMKEVYGEAAFNKRDQIQWDVAADRCNYVRTPAQGENECGFYALKMACVYDGNQIVEKIDDNKVVSFPCQTKFSPILLHAFLYFFVSLIFSLVYFFSEES